jgi:hypothetical protein
MVFMGYLLTFGLALVMIVTFIYAFFSSDYRVTINTMGEANIELIYIVCVLVVSIFGFIGLKKIGERKYEAEN